MATIYLPLRPRDTENEAVWIDAEWSALSALYTHAIAAGLRRDERSGDIEVGALPQAQPDISPRSKDEDDRVRVIERGTRSYRIAVAWRRVFPAERWRKCTRQIPRSAAVVSVEKKHVRSDTRAVQVESRAGVDLDRPIVEVRGYQPASRTLRRNDDAHGIWLDECARLGKPAAADSNGDEDREGQRRGSPSSALGASDLTVATRAQRGDTQAPVDTATGDCCEVAHQVRAPARY